MNAVALTGILAEEPELHESATEPVRCTMRLAVPRHDRGGRRTASVVYVRVTTFGLEACDCAERLHRGDRIGVTGRLEQDKHRTPEGWRVKHSGLAPRRSSSAAAREPLLASPLATTTERRSTITTGQPRGRARRDHQQLSHKAIGDLRQVTELTTVAFGSWQRYGPTPRPVRPTSVSPHPRAHRADRRGHLDLPNDDGLISLTPTPDGPRNLNPVETVVTFVPPKSDFVKNTIRSFAH